MGKIRVLCPHTLGILCSALTSSGLQVDWAISKEEYGWDMVLPPTGEGNCGCRHTVGVDLHPPPP